MIPVLIRQLVRLEIVQIDRDGIELVFVGEFDEGIAGHLLAPPVWARWHRQPEVEVLRLGGCCLAPVDVNPAGAGVQPRHFAELLSHDPQGLASLHFLLT